MPIYEYEPDGESVCEFCARGFEIIQKISDPPLKKCPECGQACKRMFSAFAVNESERSLLSNKNVEAQGFTKYEKKGDGYYERTAGKQGPESLHAGD